MPTATETDREPLVPLDEVLDYTGLTASAFYSLRHKGGGPPAYKLGRRLMFRWSEVEEWVNSRRDDREPA